MRKIIILFVFVVFGTFGVSAPGLHLDAFAGKRCTICFTDHSDGTPEGDAAQKELTCAHGHASNIRCVAESVKVHADLHALETHGLPCCGENCTEKFPLNQIKDLLAPAEKLALESRIRSAHRASSNEAEEQKIRDEVKRLQEGIEDSFNLCCPVDGCRNTLDQIEGCNAATCSSEKCKTTFCYLCLEPQSDSQAAHAHVREHSGNYWEQRPGYAARYQWLLSRRKLANLFERKVTDGVRLEALTIQKKLLEEKNMWPMPAGLMSSDWIKEIRNSELSREKKIELLQNEHIYRRQVRDLKNAALVDQELQTMGEKVLASLDVKDAQGIHPAQRVAQPVVAVAQAGGAAGQHAVAHAGAAQALPLAQGHELVPVMENHPRFAAVPAAFARLGNMYEVGGVIWSGRAPETMNQRRAVKYCRKIGGELPRADDEVNDFEALARAMGKGTPAGYDRNRIPDMAGNWFWSSSVHRVCGGDAYVFTSGNGYVDASNRVNDGSVRCVLR